MVEATTLERPHAALPDAISPERGSIRVLAAFLTDMDPIKFGENGKYSLWAKNQDHPDERDLNFQNLAAWYRSEHHSKKDQKRGGLFSWFRPNQPPEHGDSNALLMIKKATLDPDGKLRMEVGDTVIEPNDTKEVIARKLKEQVLEGYKDLKTLVDVGGGEPLFSKEDIALLKRKVYKA